MRGDFRSRGRLAGGSTAQAAALKTKSAEFDIIEKSDQDLPTDSGKNYSGMSNLSQESKYLGRMSVSKLSLDFVRAMGVQDVPATCTECGHQFLVALSAIEVSGETALSEIVVSRHLGCSECSGLGKIDVAAIGFSEAEPAP